MNNYIVTIRWQVAIVNVNIYQQIETPTIIVNMDNCHYEHQHGLDCIIVDLSGLMCIIDESELQLESA